MKNSYTRVAVSDLHFDRENPRLAEYGITAKTSEAEILKILWECMDVAEIVQSIAASGFFPQEALIVAKESGKNVVIEGNRRLAALKVLLNPQLAKEHSWDVVKLSASKRDELREVPVILESREEAWRYLGFKHVNGAAKWSSFAKAQYIADVHRNYGIPLEDIGQQIGDRHRTVQRLYRGLMVLEQAEAEKVFNREDKFHGRFFFSHLYTALDFDGVTTFLSVAPQEKETTTPVPKKKIPELGEFLTWLYGSKKKSIPPAVKTQNPDLRRLDAVLQHREAIAALRSGDELSNAYEISRPSKAVFEESLLRAKRELMKARGLLTEGYDGSRDLLIIAESITELSSDIQSEMERKSSKSAVSKKAR